MRRRGSGTLFGSLCNNGSLTQVLLCRFYFGDENKPDGSPANADWSDTAHATAYWDAISRKERGNWYLRFGGDGKPFPEEISTA